MKILVYAVIVLFVIFGCAFIWAIHYINKGDIVRNEDLK